MRGICLDKTRVILNLTCTLARSGLKTLAAGERVPFGGFGGEVIVELTGGVKQAPLFEGGALA